MNTLEKEVVDLIMKKVTIELDGSSELDTYSIEQICKKVEKIRKYRVRDFEAALSYFKNIIYFMKEESGISLGDKELKRLNVLEQSKIVIELIINNRRERNRAISVDTNILTHAPYFVGGSRTRKKEARDQGHILLEKGGIRTVTYENDTGEMLTMEDVQTLLALFYIWEKQGFGEWVTFTEHQILAAMNLTVGGKQYKQIRNSLNKLWNTSIVMHQAYDVEKGRREVTERFKLVVADKETKEYHSTNGSLRSKTYDIQFSNYLGDSIKGGYYSFISLVVFNELEVDTARGLYLMMTGLNDMDRNDKYVRNDRSLEIDLKEVYSTLGIESAPYRNRQLVEKGCEELQEAGVLDEFHFDYKGNRAVKLYLYPSEWHLSMINKKDKLLGRENTEQLKFIDFDDPENESD